MNELETAITQKVLILKNSFKVNTFELTQDLLDCTSDTNHNKNRRTKTADIAPESFGQKMLFVEVSQRQLLSNYVD